MYFCAIQSEGLHTQTDFTFVRRRKWKLIDLKNLGWTNLVKSDDLRSFGSQNFLISRVSRLGLSVATIK
jgi:hypothetical protein